MGPVPHEMMRELELSFSGELCAACADEAVAAADAICLPVAMKAPEAAFGHKSDVDGALGRLCDALAHELRALPRREAELA